MKEHAHASNNTEVHELLHKIKEELRQEVLEEVEEKGLRDRVFAEYYDLANSAGRLLGLLSKYNFPVHISEEDRQVYDALMRKISVSGLRCQILVEASTESDYESFLMSTPVVSEMAN